MEKEKYEILIEKFENDIKKRSRFLRFLLSIDQTINVVFWNGSQDETISSHIGRRKKNGKANSFEIKLCCFLEKLEYNHCNISIGE